MNGFLSPQSNGLKESLTQFRSPEKPELQKKASEYTLGEWKLLFV